MTDLEVEDIVQEHRKKVFMLMPVTDDLTDLMRDEEELEEVTEQQFDESDQKL